jgi:hypothetical protein
VSVPQRKRHHDQGISTKTRSALSDDVDAINTAFTEPAQISADHIGVGRKRRPNGPNQPTVYIIAGDR